MLFWGDLRDGDKGEEMYGVLEGDWFRSREKFELFDGERDKERRSWRMAELASTWWMPE